MVRMHSGTYDNEIPLPFVHVSFSILPKQTDKALIDLTPGGHEMLGSKETDLLDAMKMFTKLR